MKFRVAIASSDGIVVNQHFGHADKFHVVEINTENERYNFVDTRPVTPCCNSGNHEDDAFDRVISSLNDVQAVLVSRIGDGAADYLEEKGIAAYQAPYPIEPLLNKIINDKLWEVDKWQYPTKN